MNARLARCSLSWAITVSMIARLRNNSLSKTGKNFCRMVRLILMTSCKPCSHNKAVSAPEM